MPLEPLPPPSPRGKNLSSPKASPPPQPKPKHKCSASQPCDIRLSDIGKIFHTFPKGTFHTRYTPPAIPKSVLDFFITHPFSWTTKSGPNAGKYFPVSYIPTSCRKTDNRSVRWTVDLFHSFKAHLSPQLLDAKGWVPTPLVRIYQSNMLIHFCRQALAPKPPSKPSPIPPIPPPPPNSEGQLNSRIPPLSPPWSWKDSVLRSPTFGNRWPTSSHATRHPHQTLLYPPHPHMALSHCLQTLRHSLIHGAPWYLASLTSQDSNAYSTTYAVLLLSGQSAPPLPSSM